METDNVLGVRFWSKVIKTDGCWLWAGAQNKGYGVYSVNNRAKNAYKLAYESIRGKVPCGLELDHLCEVKNCVNPDHLEPVTHQENMRRSRTRWNNKTHCKNGHEYTLGNVLINKIGSRYCRTCRADAVKRYDTKQRSLSYGAR